MKEHLYIFIAYASMLEKKKFWVYYLFMCTNPLILHKYGMNPETGKPFIKVKRRLDWSLADYYQYYGRDSIILAPCGHCAECILQRRKEWSFRCNLESLYHKASSFITLTYDDDHLPSTMKQVKIDLKKFIKSIRNSGFKVRYFGCGECGEKYGRKHAHIILFGFMPSDLEYDSDSDSGEAIFTSNFVDKLWNKGRCVVQLCGKNVGQYVAGYTSKKLGLSSGFQIQSTRPGIGYQYLIDHQEDILKYAKIYSESGIGSVPRYFKKLFSDAYQFVSQFVQDVQSKVNYKEARRFGITHIEEMNFKNEEHFNNVLSLLGRSL